MEPYILQDEELNELVFKTEKLCLAHGKQFIYGNIDLIERKEL